MRKAIGGLVWAAMILATGIVEAATITVNPGGSIQSAIDSAAAGDTVLVRNGDYPQTVIMRRNGVTLKGESLGARLFRPTRSDTAVSIRCDDCAVVGLTIENYDMAISAFNTNNQYDRVLLDGNHTIGCRMHIWVEGTFWRVQNNNLERVIYNASGDADFLRFFNTDHKIGPFNWFHGTQLPNDLRPASGSDWAHSDGAQTYNNNGERIERIEIYNNFFDTYIQGNFLENNTGNLTLVDIHVHDNYFYGRNFQAVGNLIGMPSHGVYAGKNGRIVNFRCENNLFFNNANQVSIVGFGGQSQTSLKGNIFTGNGTVYNFEGNTQVSAITGPNLLFNNGWLGPKGGLSGDITGVNPQFRNLSDPYGNDGVPWTDDDGVIATNPAAAAFGPRRGTTPPPAPDVTPPVITLLGANPLTLAFGATFTDPGASVTDNVDATRTIQGTGNVNTGAAGTYTRTYAATDAAGNPAVSRTRTVIVQAAPIPNNPPSANAGPDSTIQLAAGQTTAQVTLNGSGADSDGSIVAYVWTGSPNPADVQNPVISLAAGVYTFSLTVRDDDGATSAADAVQVTVLTAPVVPPAEDVATQKELDDAVAALTAAINALRADMNAADSQERTARIEADNVINARIDNLPAPSTEAQIKAWIDAAIQAQPKQTITVLGATP